MTIFWSEPNCADFVVNRRLILAQIENEDQAKEGDQIPKQSRDLHDPNGGSDVQEPCRNYRRSGGPVTRIARIRSCTSRRRDERAIEIQQYESCREPRASSTSSAGADRRFRDHGIFLFFGEELRAKALN